MSQQGSDQNNPENSAERPPVRPISLRPGDSSGGLGSTSGALPAPLKLQPLGRPGAGPPPTPPSPLVRPGTPSNLGPPPPVAPAATPPPAPGYMGPASGRPPVAPGTGHGQFTPGSLSQGPPVAPAAGPPPPASASPSRIEFQQLELKGAKAAAAAAAAAAAGAASVGPTGVNIPPRPVSHKSAEKPPEDPSGVVPRDWPPRKVDLAENTSSGTVPIDQVSPAPRFLPGPESSVARGRNSGTIRPPEASRAPLGPPPDLEEPPRGGMETDSKASWGEGSGPAPTGGRQLPRPKPQRAPMGKGPIVLVTAFAAVLLAVVVWPPKKGGSTGQPVAAVTPSETPEAPSSPVESPLVLTSETPEAVSPTPSETPKAASPTPSETPEEMEVPAPTPKPVARVTPKPSPKPVALVTPKPSPKPVETPKPVAVATPKPIVEEPPAKSDMPTCSVRVSVHPSDVDAKVYLVNDNERYSDHSAGSVRLQQIKKGTYTLKVIANGYETFVKKIEVSKEHKLSVRLDRVPPPEPAYNPPAPGPAPSYDPAPYNPPAPAPYYPPPAPSGGSYQIPAPGI